MSSSSALLSCGQAFAGEAVLTAAMPDQAAALSERGHERGRELPARGQAAPWADRPSGPAGRDSVVSTGMGVQTLTRNRMGQISHRRTRRR